MTIVITITTTILTINW